MKNRLITLLLLLNLIATITAGYLIYTKENEATVSENKLFEKNVYQAISMLMSGQSQLSLNQDGLNIALLRVHHFVEPHTDRFYENCPECLKDRARIIKEDNEKDDIDGGGHPIPIAER